MNLEEKIEHLRSLGVKFHLHIEPKATYTKLGTCYVNLEYESGSRKFQFSKAVSSGAGAMGWIDLFNEGYSELLGMMEFGAGTSALRAPIEATAIEHKSESDNDEIPF